MNSPAVAIASSGAMPTTTHSAVNHPAVNQPIVLQPRLIDRSQRLKLKVDLQQALQQAPAVIVDLIWINAIDPDTIAVFKDALHLAAQFGKSIAFHGANRELSMLLAQEQDRLRNQNLGHWQPQPEPEFHDFLRDRAHWQTEAATVPDGEIVFPRFGLPASKTT